MAEIWQIGALSPTDKATIALAIVTGVLALVALLQLFAFTRSEARRTQPVAILNKRGPRDLQGNIGVSITNRGFGTAFNVRVGVKLDRIEYPLGPGDGNRYEVSAGGRVPDQPQVDLTLQVPPWPYALARGGPNVDSRAIFYARYENAFGKLYETQNPVDPLDSFKVRRARLSRVRRRWQAWRRADEQRVVERRTQEEVVAARTARPIAWHRRILRRLRR